MTQSYTSRIKYMCLYYNDKLIIVIFFGLS